MFNSDSFMIVAQIMTRRGQYVRSIGRYGNGRGEFDCLAGVAATRNGQLIVTDRYEKE